MTFRRAAALAFGLCLVGVASHAQNMNSAPDGPYLRLEGGWNHLMNMDARGSNSAFTASTTEDEGFLLGGAAGYAMEPFRFDFTFDYRNNGVSSVVVPGLAGGGSGSVESYAALVNAYYDFNSINMMGIVPYVGLGIGAVDVSLNNLREGATQVVNDSDIMPAAQAMAGLRYQLTPNWGLGLEYRFLNGFHPSFKAATGAQFTTDDYRNHSVLLSVTYNFGAPPPPPPMAEPTPAAMTPPPAAPAPAQPVMKGPGRNLFLVFFDFNKSTITEAGQKVLDAAAAAYQDNRAVRIEVTGYTDTVGTQQYNMGLSKRRADAVADYLSKHGVPQTAMDVAWKGKEDLRVPTPDNVREPQNRRVEIILP